MYIGVFSHWCVERRWVNLTLSLHSVFTRLSIPQVPCQQCAMISHIVDDGLCACLVYYTDEEVCCDGWQGDNCDVCSLDCGERRMCDPFSNNATCVCDYNMWMGENCEMRMFFLTL